jgi:hypothetical protein
MGYLWLCWICIYTYKNAYNPILYVHWLVVLVLLQIDPHRSHVGDLTYDNQ